VPRLDVLVTTLRNDVERHRDVVDYFGMWLTMKCRYFAPPDVPGTRSAGRALRASAALCSVLIFLTSQTLASGPLLLPETIPPNLATIDPDALRTRASRGDGAAAADLGTLYAHGWKVPRDPAEAIRWLTRAISQKNKSAERELGLMLLRGDGVARDPERGVTLLQSAASGGDVTAEAAIGAA
jgi:hypothetical protein